jgi:signal transduction histidine kinase
MPVRETSPRLLTVLIAGFTVLILLLSGAAYIAIGAIETVSSEAEQLVAEEQAAVRLINEVQSEEGNLSAVFYSVAAGRKSPDRSTLLRRLDNLESAIHKTTDLGIASGRSPLWRKVKQAADLFIAEGRDTIQTARPVTDAFFVRHQNLIDAVAELASASFAAESDQERREKARAAGRVRYSLVLLGIALAVALAGAILTVYTVNGMFRRLQWQALELAQLSSRTMSDQEQTARRFSHEMHDHFGQTLSALEANIVAMQHSRAYQPERIEDCLALIKGAVDNVREMSQLLRPSILDDFGLNASLRWLADSFADRTGIRVQFESSFLGRLGDERETQLFRIAQEALTNVARHANATEVRIRLAVKGDQLQLTIADNGQGFVRTPGPGEQPRSVRDGGLGLLGMRARARAANGTLEVDSAPGSGVTIAVTVPLERSNHVAKDPHLVSG